MSRERAGPRGGAPLLLALGALALSGCCLGGRTFSDEDLPRTKALATPFDTVDYIRFCVRHELWSALYATLSAATLRAEPFNEPDGKPSTLGEVGFATVFPRLTFGKIYPDAPAAIRDILLVDMIHASGIARVAYRPTQPWRGAPAGRQAYVALDYDPIDLTRTTFLLIDEGTDDAPRWSLGLNETGRWQQQLQGGP